MGANGKRSAGTILMGIGLLLVLTAGGYFAWTEVQAGQVRSELQQSAAAAAERATRIAVELAQATPTAGATQETSVQAATDSSAELAAAAKAALTATQKPILPASTATPRPAATATRRTSPTATKARPSPTAAPPATATTVTAAIAPVRMAIPDLKIDAKVVEMGWQVVQTKSGPVSQWVIPKNAAGHHLNSAGLGQPDNLVISGHNNIYGKVLMPISQAWNNDTRVKVDNFTDKSPVLDGRELVLYDAAGTPYKYVITEFYRLKDTGVSAQQREVNGRYIQPTGDERVTIVTCWPPTNNTHRLIVIARPEK